MESSNNLDEDEKLLSNVSSWSKDEVKAINEVNRLLDNLDKRIQLVYRETDSSEMKIELEEILVQLRDARQLLLSRRDLE